jgi:peptidoglycan hydrolase-like protein with peptidoglycan-binding domain
MQKSIKHIFIFIFVIWGYSAMGQLAPDRYVWIQIEAQPNRAAAMARIKTYKQEISNVVGFEIEGGWFGIALGPYKSDAADTLLAKLKKSELIPRDSFVARGVTYGRQFYAPRSSIPKLATAQSLTETKTDLETELSGTDNLELTKISENALTFDEKRYLQRALAWASHYQGKIDGLYGPETRRAMKDWQIENKYPKTGVMTPSQRGIILNNFTPVMTRLNLAPVTNLRAGITLLVPRGIMGSAQYDAPFVRFEATDSSNTQIILISQVGDAKRLRALFEVIQTLNIVPKGGALKLDEAGFSIETSNNELFTTGFAKLIDGEIKGAILVWPTKDEAQRLRLKEQIFGSFDSFKGVLPEAEFFETGLLPKDILSGLQIRQPIFARSGIFLNAQGMVLTASQDLEICGSIEVGFGTQVKIKASNSYVTVLSPMENISPPAISSFQLGPLKAPRRITAGGYSYGGSLGSPTLTRGLLQDLKDLANDRNISRLEINTLPGDAGGPIYNSGGAVIGILLPKREDPNRQLPDDVHFAANLDLIISLLDEENIQLSSTETKVHSDLVNLSKTAKNSIALVKCWE